MFQAKLIWFKAEKDPAQVNDASSFEQKLFSFPASTFLLMLSVINESPVTLQWFKDSFAPFYF